MSISGRARGGHARALTWGSPMCRWRPGTPTTTPKRVGFFTGTSVGIGYKACEVACKEWNTLLVRGHRPAQGRRPGLQVHDMLRPADRREDARLRDRVPHPVDPVR